MDDDFGGSSVFSDIVGTKEGKTWFGRMGLMLAALCLSFCFPFVFHV